MRNPTITNELHREGTMFQNRFMSTLDDPGNELFSGTFRDLILGLVADTATLFQPLQNGVAPSIGVMNCTSDLIIFIVLHPPYNLPGKTYHWCRSVCEHIHHREIHPRSGHGVCIGGTAPKPP